MSGPVDGNSEFEQHLRDCLIESSEALDGRTRSRLTQARYAALEQAGGRRNPRWQTFRGWAPAGAVAMALLVTVFFVQQRGAVVPGAAMVAATQSAGTLEDMDLLADADGYALSIEAEAELDPDFYEWAASSNAGDGPST